MFENILYQQPVFLLADDIRKNTLPQSLLFYGPSSQGKLTCALELARVLSCRAQGEKRGDWLCGCPSCLAHKTLSHPDLVIAGPRDCSLEILAAKNTLLHAAATGVSLPAARYLFIRSVRKLTARFNPALWAEDDKVAKIAPLVAAVDEQLETLDPFRPLPPAAELEKNCETLVAACRKLEDTGMYEAVPIAQIRRLAAWARLTTGGGKKIAVIENADRMQEGARNALLKILEEPPEQTVFILTAVRKNAVLPTILSRLRSYGFALRTQEQQKEVITRIFRTDATPYASLEAFLYTFLPVPLSQLRTLAALFLESAAGSAAGEPPLSLCRKIAAEANSFEPRVLFRLFLTELTYLLSQKIRAGQAGLPASLLRAAAAKEMARSVNGAHEQVMVYNQNPAAVLELLAERLARSGGAL